MAQITAIIAKDRSDTSVTFSPMSAAAGDKTEAVWHAQSLGTGIASRPVLTHAAQWNGPKTARRHHIKMVVPRVVADQVTDRAIFDLTVTLPANLPDTVAEDAYALFSSAISSALVKTSLKEGFAAS